MKDIVIKGTGNSRLLKTSLGAETTWTDALSALRDGTFPIDLSGYNAEGIDVDGTPLNTANLLADVVAELLGGDTSMTPSQAFERLFQLCALKSVAITATLPSAGWTKPSGSAKYTQTISVGGVTAACHLVVSYAAASHDLWLANEVYCSEQGAGTLTFMAAAKPTANVTANVLSVG
jgi:hypothetical protein